MRSTSAGMRRAGQAKRLGDPQAAAVEQRHHGGIAGLLPVVAGDLPTTVQHPGGALFGQRAGQLAADAGPARRQDGGRVLPQPVGGPGGEALHRRQRARQRARLDPPRPRSWPSRRAGPKGRWPPASRRPVARPGVAPESPGSARHRRHRPGSCAACPLQRRRWPASRPARPALRPMGRASHDSQRRIVRSKTPAKKARRSVPWVGLNWCGSSAPSASMPGSRPLPKSSRSSASDRTNPARSL
jgi:hypothetical protein